MYEMTFRYINVKLLPKEDIIGFFSRYPSRLSFLYKLGGLAVFNVSLVVAKRARLDESASLAAFLKSFAET